MNKVISYTKNRTSKNIRSTLSLIDAVEITLFYILSKLASQLKSVKEVSESFEILASFTLISSRVFWILL